MSTPLLKKPFKNEHGQVINIGDTVIAIAQGYSKRVHVRLGVYVGLREDSRGNVTSVTARVNVRDWKYDHIKKAGEYRTISRLSTLPNQRIYPTEAVHG
jgi:hypothetical protein